MSGNNRRNIGLRTRDETNLAQELLVPEQDQFDPAQSGAIEEERGYSIRDPAVQQHPQRYPMAVCDPEERWVREYIEQTGEEPGFF